MPSPLLSNGLQPGAVTIDAGGNDGVWRSGVRRGADA